MSSVPSEIYVPELRTASAVERPCALRQYHSPMPVVTQGHHRHPVYLQNRIYGAIRDPELLWLCGSDHDAVHAWLYWLLEERARPTVDPGWMVKKEALTTYEWYVAATLKKRGETIT
jgi:hypothetical protein